MSEQGSKKIKVFNLAKDLNLSSETIIDFLKKKDFDIKSHMSIVTDEMMPVIMGHFKKDKEVADRHQRKLQEFRSTRKKESPEKAEVKSAAKDELQPSIIDEVKPSIEEIEVKSVEEIPQVQADKKEKGQTDEFVLQETARVQVQPELFVLEKEKHEKPDKSVEEQVNKENQLHPKKRAMQSPLEAALARPQRGLTIKGKIDLTPAKSVQKQDVEEEKKRKKKKKKVREEVKRTKTSPAKTEDEEESKTRKRKRVRRAEVNEDEVAKAIRETLSDSGDELAIARAAIRKKKKEKREEEEQKKLDQLEHDRMRIKATEFVTVGELANLMRVSVADVIQKVMGLGIMVSINQRLDKDTITLVSDEFGFLVDFE
jgi:translation initiation factor IF-2